MWKKEELSLWGKGVQLLTVKFFLSAWNRWLGVKVRLRCCFYVLKTFKKAGGSNWKSWLYWPFCWERLGAWALELLKLFLVFYFYIGKPSEKLITVQMSSSCILRGWPWFQAENVWPIPSVFLVINCSFCLISQFLPWWGFSWFVVNIFMQVVGQV